MLYRAALFALPIIALGQAPPEVDQALRARVTEFFQAHVDGNFRKAFDLVADDTKDYYFSAQKNKLQSFKIDGIEYSDEFTHALIQLTAERMWKMSAQLPESKVIVPMRTTWKIEQGKWVFYHDPKDARILPMGNPGQARSNSGEVAKLPDVSESAIAAAAQKILQQSKVDKTLVRLPRDKASSDQVVFHNGAQGWVQVMVDMGRKIPGLTAEVDKANVNFGEDAVIKLRYEPSDDPPPAETRVVVVVQPFNQTFPISILFDARP